MSEALRCASQLVDILSKFKTPSTERGRLNGAIQELRRLAPMEAELAATHKALAEAVLKAEQGWARYENANRLSNSLQEELAALRASLSEPVAWLYTLEYGAVAVNKMVSEWKLNYPFGVCGADYLRSNDDGISYVRETPLYAIKDQK